jgi:hypothetical protein
VRFYDIKFTDPDGNLIKTFGLAKDGFQTNYTSFVEGQNISAALNVEFNIPQGPWATPQQGSWLRIWGIGLDEISYANNLGPQGEKLDRLCGITIEAGFQQGLPLANPAQRGVIVQGSIFKPFGNWQMTDQTLEMIILPAVGTTAGQTVSLPFDCPVGTTIGDAIKQTLSSGLPLYTVEVFTSPELKLSYRPVGGPYSNLTQFAAMITKLTQQSQFAGIKTLSGGKYAGVNMRVVGRTITVYDGTVDLKNNTFSNPKKIEFQELIGQPTWIGPASIHFKCPLRADINVGDYVSLPSSLAVPYVLTTPSAAIPGAPSRNNLTFQGKWVIVNVRQIGHSRSPSVDAWATNYQASYAGDLNALVSKPVGISPNA